MTINKNPARDFENHHKNEGTISGIVKIYSGNAGHHSHCGKPGNQS